MELQTRAAKEVMKRDSHKEIADRSCKRNCKFSYQKELETEIAERSAKRSRKRTTKRHAMRTKQEMQKITYFEAPLLDCSWPQSLGICIFVVFNGGAFSSPRRSRSGINTTQI